MINNILIEFPTSFFHNKTTNVKLELSHDNTTLTLNIKDLIECEETISPFTMNNTTHKYIIEELYFTITTNTKRIINTIHYLKFWATFPNINCLIIFEENDFMNNKNIIEYLIHEGILCKIQISNITNYEERYLELFHLAWQNQNRNVTKSIQWFIVSDDDTIWFINNLLHTLQQYNSSISIYLGNISDRKSQIKRHGDYYAYGGGGILLSRSLALLLSKYNQQCKQYRKIYGGDAVIGKCITEILNVSLIKNRNFQQMDYSGDMAGYFESGIYGLVSLHHMFSLWKLFPDGYADKINETMSLLQLAYMKFDKNFLKRYIQINRITNQTLLLTMGYSVSLFNRILSYEDLQQVENTWNGDEMTMRKYRSKEKNKTTWYFRRIIKENFNNSIQYRTVYENRHNQIQYINVILC
ncbi:unnamed protein product [Adineta steineri]|uniref:Uncharacterized protein n=1 Tax=Adineta steineri TaxID=433720 RepID=A0A814Y6B0_9BILA|nr:unnamed protein product [Adineta steineri]CAF3968817.1 unnamed protein product [Adineta steineri]